MQCVRANLATTRVRNVGKWNGRKPARKTRCEAASAPAIRVSDAALDHIKRLREESGGEEVLLRVGVKEGGCSGMSYTMDFAEKESVTDEDSVLEFGDMKIICDPKSLLARSSEGDSRSATQTPTRPAAVENPSRSETSSRTGAAPLEPRRRGRWCGGTNEDASPLREGRDAGRMARDVRRPVKDAPRWTQDEDSGRPAEPRQLPTASVLTHTHV
eukprot:scaffold177_cov334-Pavlova_lutheri.AAC.83